MKIAELKVKLTADVTQHKQNIAKLREQLTQQEMLLLKKQGALEALALLEQESPDAETTSTVETVS